MEHSIEHAVGILIVQGLTMKPLIQALKLEGRPEPSQSDPAHHQEGIV